MSDAKAYPPPPGLPGDAPPPLGAGVPADELPDGDTKRALFEHMVTSRLVEERIVELYRLGKITGGCYTGIGNEATAVAAALALGPEDVLVPTHRDMGAHLVRGHGVTDILLQYLKRAASQTEGKDTGLHLGREGSNIVGMISHLAHMMPVAVGVALAERQLGRRTVVLTTVGDGSTSLGDFHESLNFASVQKLPVLFLIENNQYAYSTPNTIQYACARLADRAVGYGMAGERVDGTDALAVWAAARRAYARGRAGQGPTLLECVTMRMRGHSEHDDFKYVPRPLLEAWRRWDPIERLAAHLAAEGHAAPGLAAAVRDRVAAELDRAVEVAEASAPPQPDAAGRDVYRLWRDEWTVPCGTERELARGERRSS